MEQFSRIIAGFWRLMDWPLRDQALQSFIEQCLEAGVTSFDHADIYGGYRCETLFGDALALKPSLRGKIQLVTKCGIKLKAPHHHDVKLTYYDTSARHIIGSVEKSLKNLKTDYIDLLLIHRPDPFMDPDQVAEAFNRLQESGMVKEFGVSNFTPSQFILLSSRMDSPLITNQVEFSVLNMKVLDDGTMDMCQQFEISPMAWSPLSGGRLFSEQSEQAVRVRQILKEIATRYPGSTIDQIALAWILNHPAGIYPVVGSGKIERIKAAMASLEIKLTREEWFEIWTASKGHGVP